MSVPTSIEHAAKTLQNADVVAFDWDGTLIDSVPYKLAQNQAIAHESGKDLSIEQVRDHWLASAGFTDLMQRLTGSSDMSAIMRIVNRDYNNPSYVKRPFEFTPRLLTTLRQLGKRTALLTNATRHILDADAQSVELLPLTSYFDYVQTADETPYKKPDPRAFDPLLRSLDVSPAQVVYIGDELNDLRAAHSAGINFIGVETGMASHAELASQNVCTIRSLGDLSLQSHAGN